MSICHFVPAKTGSWGGQVIPKPEPENWLEHCPSGATWETMLSGPSR
ncbi:MAG: hypothetical protein AB7U07_14960 [Thermoleophilia bacterium]